MHNRGNGKGGGIAAVGLVPESWGSRRRFWTPITCFRWRCSIRRRGPKWKQPYIAPFFDVAQGRTASDTSTITVTSRAGGQAAGCAAAISCGSKKACWTRSSMTTICRTWIRARPKTSSSTRTPSASIRRFTRHWGKSGPLCCPTAAT